MQQQPWLAPEADRRPPSAAAVYSGDPLIRGQESCRAGYLLGIRATSPSRTAVVSRSPSVPPCRSRHHRMLVVQLPRT